MQLNHQSRIQTNHWIFHQKSFRYNRLRKKNSWKVYLKRDSNEFVCDAEVVVRNRSDFDPETVCGDDHFLPVINSIKESQNLSLLLQALI